MAYGIAPNQKDPLEKMFSTIIIAMTALLFFATLEQMSYLIPFVFRYADGSSWMLWEALRLIVCAIPVIAYFSYLYWTNKKHAK